jgi:hypothetical protein
MRASIDIQAWGGPNILGQVTVGRIVAGSVLMAHSCRSLSKLGGAKILGQVKLNRLSWRQWACSIKGVGTQATTSSACQIEQVQISLALPAMSLLCGVTRQSIGT